MNYRAIIFRKYKNTPLEEIPMSYLIWMFSAYKDVKEFQPLYKEFLEYFLKKDVRVEKSLDNIYYFFFNDYFNPDSGTGERPFLHSYWGMKNSKGNLVYEVGPLKSPYYIEKIGDRFEISNKYVNHKYKFGGIRMVYEKNPDYYFQDNQGRIMNGAFLMRKPFIPKETLTPETFSDNKLINK